MCAPFRRRPSKDALLCSDAMYRTPRIVVFLILCALATFSGCAHKARANALAEETGQDIAQRVIAQTALQNALNAAQATVAQAIQTPQLQNLSADDLRARFLRAAKDARWKDAAIYNAFWQAPLDDADGQEAEILLLLAQQNYRDARTRAWNLVDAFQHEDPRWIPLWYQSYMADPNFWRPVPYDMIRGQDYEKLAKLGGGSTVSLKVLDQDENILSMIKPHSELGQTYSRGEIAAYRPCELMQCGFSVPRNIEVRFTLKEFLRAYGVAALKNRSQGYARRFSDIIVFEDEKGEPWIHATMKDWVPGYTTYPIEHVDGWISLLNGYTPIETLRQMSLEDALRPMRGKERAYIPAMLERNQEGTDGLDFARQLSNLHVFDYLLNNWDRYSGVYWGVNCHWNHGQFVSIDNGASFQRRNWGNAVATRTRMRVIRRYSKTTVAAIRAMDKDLTRELLFPDNAHHPGEDDRFESFWARRDDFLQWIDELIERRGEAQTLSLP